MPHPATPLRPGGYDICNHRGVIIGVRPGYGDGHVTRVAFAVQVDADGDMNVSLSRIDGRDSRTMG
jgi:hypothetical protein